MEWRSPVVIIQSETVIAWRRRAFRRLWIWKSRHRVGRTAVSPDVGAVIRTMAQANAFWGAAILDVNRAWLHYFSCGRESWVDGFTISEFDPLKLFTAALIDQPRKYRKRTQEEQLPR